MRPAPSKDQEDEEDDAERTLVPQDDADIEEPLGDFSLLSLSTVGVSIAHHASAPSSPESVYLSAPSSPADSVSHLPIASLPMNATIPRTHELDDPSSDWEHEWLEATNSDSDHDNAECGDEPDEVGLRWDRDDDESSDSGLANRASHRRADPNHQGPPSDREDGYIASSENEEGSLATLLGRASAAGSSIKRRRSRLSESVVLIPRFAVTALQDRDALAPTSGACRSLAKMKHSPDRLRVHGSR